VRNGLSAEFGLERGEVSTMRLDENDITERVIGAAVQVHRELGPGLLESVYALCLVEELRSLDVRVRREVALPIHYRGVRLNCTHRLDCVVEDKVIVELKAVERITDLHRAQLLTYLRMAHLRVGLLVNFNVPLLKQGITRLVLGIED